MNIMDALDKIEDVDAGLRMALEHAVFVPPNRLVFQPTYRTMAAIGTSPRAQQAIAGLCLDLEVVTGEIDGKTIADTLSEERQAEFDAEAAKIMQNETVAAALRIFNGSSLVRIVKP